ncbi:MAG: hypothetical protein V3W14_09420 [Candidatus Neomarinimicrobiota bacterium]
MKRLILFPLLIWLACTEPNITEQALDPVDRNSIPADSISYGEPFALALNESRSVGGEGLEVGFKEILGDSRCPLDVMCYWQGQARIRLWLAEPGMDTLYLEPFIYGYVSALDTGSHKQVFSERYNVTLLQLDPYPGTDSLFCKGQFCGERADTALISVALNTVPLLSDALNLVDADSYQDYLHNPIDAFDIDSLRIIDDTLKVYVAYGGGCNEHDFFPFGSTLWDEGSLSRVQMVIIHDGHVDYCEAWIHRTLSIDLSIIRQQPGIGNPVTIDLVGVPDSVVYSY